MFQVLCSQSPILTFAILCVCVWGGPCLSSNQTAFCLLLCRRESKAESGRLPGFLFNCSPVRNKRIKQNEIKANEKRGEEEPMPTRPACQLKMDLHPKEASALEGRSYFKNHSSWCANSKSRVIILGWKKESENIILSLNKEIFSLFSPKQKPWIEPSYSHRKAGVKAHLNSPDDEHQGFQEVPGCGLTTV